MKLKNENLHTLECPVLDCKRRRGVGMVMCKEHWFKVAKPLRDRVWKLFRFAQGSSTHRQAIFEAIESVSER